MPRPIQRVVIAGGGTAGWLSACRLAAWAKGQGFPLDITLVEDPDTPTIGVGEGTWPTMGSTLAAIGIDEAEFLIACDASFKQGSQFEGWVDGAPDDVYLHPFTLPPAGDPRALLAAFRGSEEPNFAAAMSPQVAVVARHLAPRQRSMPAFAGALAYGYHLDAGKLAALLEAHATGRLGVSHCRERIQQVEGAPYSIAALLTDAGTRIEGDLFIDCTGFAALLIGGHAGTAWVDRSGHLLNDRALAIQVPVDADSPIASVTRATAHKAGWFWDIGLPTRRGIGCVYSSAFLDEEEARALLDDYVTRETGAAPGSAARLIAFPTGHRDRFWVGNCLAIGLSAGFIEPLEASAIVLIEASLNMLVEGFPSSDAALAPLAKRFNDTFTHRWESIVEFLKLHYVLSKRDGAYWKRHRDPATMPERLPDHLATWQDQPPSQLDFPLAQEMFPAASYQYVYYGMGGESAGLLPAPGSQLIADMASIRRKERSLLAALPTNRTYLAALAAAAAGTTAEGNRN